LGRFGGINVKELGMLAKINEAFDGDLGAVLTQLFLLILGICGVIASSSLTYSLVVWSLS